MKLARLCLSILIPIMIQACGSKDEGNITRADAGADEETQSAAAPYTSNIVQTLASDGRFGTLIGAVQIAGLEEILSGGQYTLFAPTDEAFARLPAGLLDALLSDVASLTRLLKYHVVEGDLSSQALALLGDWQSLIGNTVFARLQAGHPVLNENVEVTSVDIRASNGRIHVLGNVLTLPTIVDLLDLAGVSVLKAGLSAAGLVSTLVQSNDITVFAPTNEAFALIGMFESNIAAMVAANLPLSIGVFGRHVGLNLVNASQVVGSLSVPTLASVNLTLQPASSFFSVNNIQVLRAIRGEGVNIFTIPNVIP